MFSIFKNFLDYNAREIKKSKVTIDAINSHEKKAKSLKDGEFLKETKFLKAQIQSGKKTLEEVLPWSFALAREASLRTLGLRHYDVQMIAAIALHQGKIVEQKTGEGKTLTATAALYLNALTERGTHLVTVNDYLARRDAGWMGAIFHLLGMSTSAIISEQSYIYDPAFVASDVHDSRLSHLRPISRKEAYDADVTYGINSEFGFDYLRDNMAQSPEQLVQRGFNFAIVDEADSVLIDEARTPHIISAPYEENTSKYYDYAKIVKNLSSETDFVIDEKLKTAHLTEKGIENIEKMLGVQNIYEKDFDTLFHIEAALKATTLFKDNKDYIVRGQEVVIVDEFTGRLLEGRRFSEGLHQAIEAKEGVAIKQESKTLATVSLQNYFRGYQKLAGMTGTAATEAEEFNKIYKCDVLVVPTHNPMVRKDHSDMIYKTEKMKFQAVVEEIVTQFKAGRPVLVGTTSIDKNEYISTLLNQKGVPHEVLNAKNHPREAQIISQAGKKNAITVATNMAGRGVDIVLGGEIQRNQFKTEAQYKKAVTELKKEHEQVVKLGGLYVIGTERHESRRIDNQLRGRAGRQGDPGETRFFVSLEDDVMRIFGGEQISKLMTMLKFPEDQPLSHPMVSKAIEQAQVKVEGFNFDTRKHLVDYDDVLNKQREIVYSLRKKLLKFPEEDADKFKDIIFENIDEQIQYMAVSYFSLNVSDQKMNSEFLADIETLLGIKDDKIASFIEKSDQIGFQNYLQEKAGDIFNAKEKKVGKNTWYQIVRSLFVSTIDQFWTQHLTAIDDLREGINLRGYAQLDPLVEYKNEAFRMFEKLLSEVHYEAVRRIMRVEIEENSHVHTHTTEERPIDMNLKPASSVNPFTASQPSESEGQTVNGTVSQLTSKSVGQQKKLGRNDPCWCESGKKYKKCHYPN